MKISTKSPKTPQAIWRALGFIGIMSVLLSYQNCAVYQSDGRKLLDSNGTAVSGAGSTSASTPAPATKAGTQTNMKLEGSSRAADVASAQDPAQVGCEPYLTQGDAQQIFSAPVKAQLVFDSQQREPTCLLSQTASDTDPLGVVVCSVSYKNLQHLTDLAKNNSVALIDDPRESLKGGSFGAIEMLPAGPSLAFYGVGDGGNEAVACRIQFATAEEAESNKTAAALRTATLVHAIAPHAL